MLHLCGWSGTGKTFLLERFAKANPGSIQMVAPSDMRAVFDLSSVDFQNHAAVAIDEVLMWERSSLVAGVGALERLAQTNGKKLVLVSQTPDDLAAAGIHFSSEPLIIHLHGRQDSLDLLFDGQSIHMTKPKVIRSLVSRNTA